MKAEPVMSPEAKPVMSEESVMSGAPVIFE